MLPSLFFLYWFWWLFIGHSLNDGACFSDCFFEIFWFLHSLYLSCIIETQFIWTYYFYNQIFLKSRWPRLEWKFQPFGTALTIILNNLRLICLGDHSSINFFLNDTVFTLVTRFGLLIVLRVAYVGCVEENCAANSAPIFDLALKEEEYVSI